MHAIQVKSDTRHSLEWVEINPPTPGPTEVLIQVAAAGVNRLDLMQRAGLYPAPAGAPSTLGVEVAGPVVAVGSHVSRWKVGDSVCALLSGGGYATHAIAEAALCLPIPLGWSLVEAASLPESLFTVWINFFNRAELQQSESVLVHGGSSGIGVYAIQLLHALGHRVYTTAGNASKCAACLQLGAAFAVCYRETDFVEAILNDNGGGVDVILDLVGGDYVRRNLSLLNNGGRLCLIALPGGKTAEIDLTLFLKKQLSLVGTALRSRHLEEKSAIASALEQVVWPLLSQRKIRPVLSETFSFAEVALAHQTMFEGQHIGKLVLMGS